MREAWSRSRRLVAVALACLMLVPAGTSADGQTPECSEDEGFEYLPDVGLACRTPTGYEVLLDDGSTVYTHGGDPPKAFGQADGPTLEHPLGIANQMAPSEEAGPWGPFCVWDDDAPRFVVVDGRAAGTEDDGDDRRIREDLLRATRTLRIEAREFDAHRSYRVECNHEGRVAIHDVEVDTTTWDTSFGSIVDDLRERGFDETDEKYLVFFDQDFTDWGGIASMDHDDRPGPENENNEGPHYAVITPGADTDTVVHELGHTMGAVQTSAPNYYHNRGGDHCSDELDIMCYGLRTRRVCTDREHFDCNHDDFFHPDPPSNSYLADHWNIGDPVNRFLQSADPSEAPDHPEDLTALAGPGPDEVTLLWNPPADPGASGVDAYRIYASEDRVLLDDVALGLAPSLADPAYPVVQDDARLRADSTFEVDAVTGDYAFSYTFEDLGITEDPYVRSLATFRVSAINGHAEGPMSPAATMVAPPGP